MQIDIDHIRQLVIEEMTGTLSEEDSAWLQQARAESAEVWLMYNQLRKELDTTATREALADLSHTLPAEKVLANAKRKKKTRTIFSITSVAALVLVAVGLYSLFDPRPVPQGYSANLPRTGVQLQLAGGKVVDLSKDQQQVQVGGITINNTQKELTYTANNNTPAGMATLRVPAGKDYKIQLSDGTQVWLNAATRMEFPLSFKGRTREINIQGEAYLQVAKDPQQPFIVHLPHSTVQVLGTAFNVNTYDSGQVKVSLLEGSVKMLTPDHNRVLQPGYAIHFDAERGITMAPFDESEVLSWQKGIYNFDDKPLQEVCNIIPRWYGVNVVMDDAQTARRHFTGYFDRNKPLQRALDNLKATKLINYYFDKDGVLHIQ